MSSRVRVDSVFRRAGSVIWSLIAATAPMNFLNSAVCHTLYIVWLSRRKTTHQVHHHTTTILQPCFWDHPGEPVPEENFWTLWCKGRLTEADTLTIQLGATPSGLVTIAHLHHPPYFLLAGARMPFLPPNQQCQSTDGN